MTPTPETHVPKKLEFCAECDKLIDVGNHELADGDQWFCYECHPNRLPSRKPMTAPTAETHVFIGMFRPPFESFHASGCPACGQRFYTSVGYFSSAARECWQLGHFDQPCYRTHEEVVKMRGEA